MTKGFTSWRRRGRSSLSLLLLPPLLLCLTACSGGDGGGNPADPGIEALPSFTPSADDELASLAINTFASGGLAITVSPETIDFNESGDIELGDELTVPFTLTNNSGSARVFAFAFYAVSAGFELLDEDEIALGAWDEVAIEDGESRLLHARFKAFGFGTQTTYLTVTADVAGYIRLPMRAIVTGSADFRVIPTGYLCADTEAPRVRYLDFGKTAFGVTESLGVKVCNTGGEDIKVNSAAMLTDTSSYQSRAMDGDAFEEFLWTVEEEIASSFSLGLVPELGDSFAEPDFIAYDGDTGDPTGDFKAVILETGSTVADNIVKPDEILRLDVNFSPALDIEAPAGQLYEAIGRKAKLRLVTSIGIVDIPLLGATGGREPLLKMSYRADDSELWREVDLASDGPAVYFSAVEVFKDWVTDNYRIAEIKIENTGSGDKNLEFHPETLAGYFEYAGEADPVFPIVIPSGGESKEFKIRYIPTPSEVPDRDSWDFGQFYFGHTGGNGPRGKTALVGEERGGYAVELKLGGSELERDYDPGTSKNLCVMQIAADGVAATRQTFTVANNSPAYPLTVTWEITDSGGDAPFEASPASGTLTVEPDTSGTFSADLLADASATEGATLRGTLTVSARYPEEVEAEFAALTSDKEARDFTVPIQATASSTGVCALGGGTVVGSDGEGPITATLVFDRITMILTSLVEPARNHPSFKFHFPVEIDYASGRIRIAKSIPFVYDKDAPEFNPINQFRSFAHQITNVKGCAPLPSNPYQLEFEKGSWTGEGYDCNGDGTVSFTGKDGEAFELNSDTACLPSNGGEVVEEDGVRWVVFYHDFVKLDTSACGLDYYGKIATFAYRPDVESYTDVFARATSDPYGGEEDYEAVFGTYKFGSYIFFNVNGFSCGGRTYKQGDIETDPDAIKACYAGLAERSDAARKDGFLNECSYFNFTIDEGVVPADAEAENPDTDSWTGYGYYEPYVDAEGEVYPTKYDITLFNTHAQVFALSPGDRVSFFRHESHLLFSDLYITFTTKPIADENDPDSWRDLIAVETRSQFDENQIFLTDGDPYDIKNFWTEGGINNNFSTAVDDEAMEPGVDYGGSGKGNYRLCKTGACDIIPSGWPVNFDENNLLILEGLGSFNGKGSTAPGFAREDTSGQGKPLYFTLHGCLVEGSPDPTQGCYTYRLDDAVMDEDGSSTNDAESVVDLYREYGILPAGYPGDDAESSASECANFAAYPENDPDSPDYDPYRHMACVNYKIFPQDRNRLTNYYDSDHFYYYAPDDYGGSTCGYGM